MTRPPPAAGAHDARLAAACRRVEVAVEVAASSFTACPASALPHLHALEQALLELAGPLSGSGRVPMGI